MRKTKHFLLMAAMLLGSVGARAENIASGVCGSKLTWELTDAGELIIGGTGAMDNYTHSYGSYAPWNQYRNSIKTVTILEGVTAIGQRAFWSCICTASITIPESVTSIGYGAFMECTRLSSIDIPDGVTSIGSYAFEDCSSLASVRIPESVTSIGAGAFYGCSSLSSIKIPEKVTVIEEYTFYNCSSLTSIRIPDAVERINMYAFMDCSSLAIVTIGKSVTSVNGSSFQKGCDNIHTVINYSPLSISKGSRDCGYVAYYAHKVLDMDELDNLGGFLFYTKDGIYYLAGYIGEEKQIVFPESYKESSYQIASYAFEDCSTITSVTIPASVTAINDMAFFGCSNLADLTLHSNPSISAHAIPSATKVTLVLNDGEAADFNAANANTFDEVVYNRELGAGKYGTIMLPFAPDTESVESFAFYSLSSVDGETLIFDEVATPLANTPYLYALREGKSATQITGGETTIASAIATPEIDGWKTVGSFINQTVDCSSGDACYYAINAADNMLYNVVSKLNVKPYRAYFEGRAANAAQLRIRTRDGKETVIDAAEVEGLVPVTYYDLCGRRVASPNKGVYIVNGKKMMVK